MKPFKLFAATLFALALLPVVAPAQVLKVLTTTMDIADIARRIGGDAVNVESFARGDQDMHRIPAKPAFLLKLNSADMLFEMGLDAEHAWVPALVEACRNDKVRPGGSGFFNMSTGLKPLEVPVSLDRARGTDFHPRGNPHFNISVAGGRLIARNILAAFTGARPANAAVFRKNYDGFIAELDRREVEWKKIAEPLKGKKFVCRHAIWPYLAEEFGFTVVGDLEPKPGLEPTPSHVVEIKNIIRTQGVSGILVPPYVADGLSRAVADDTKCPLIILPIGVTGSAPTATYLDYLDHVIRTLAKSVGDSRPATPK